MGHTEEEFVDNFVNFVLEIGGTHNDITLTTELEEELINSKFLENHNLSKKFQEMMMQYLTKLRKTGQMKEIPGIHIKRGTSKVKDYQFFTKQSQTVIDISH